MILKLRFYLFFITFIFFPVLAKAGVLAGVGKEEITPAIGTPSAGYTERKGEGMEGIHDPLLATALFIDNGVKKIVFCGVDHLGFTHQMVQQVTQQIRRFPELSKCEVYIGSSHTHSGGGAYLNIPVLGEALAGAYSVETTQRYIDRTVEAVLAAYRARVPAKVGIGYGQAQALSQYRGMWPKEVTPLSDIALIKVTKLDGTPLAALFNYPIHPTVLKSQNRLFSADFVGYARDALQDSLGAQLQPIFFNGAQGDIIPAAVLEEEFDSCAVLGRSLAASVKTIWNATKTSEEFLITTRKHKYTFQPQPTPHGLILPLKSYESEINTIVLNKFHAFITIPGELSCLYDYRLKEEVKKLGFDHLSIFGLINDAHGYIILPESWRNKTFESGLSFGGEEYGDWIAQKAIDLIRDLTPPKDEIAIGF